MTRRTASSIALSAAVLLAAVVGAAPARAADEVGLSPDGVVWYDALHRALFDPQFRWVPGNAEVASFYVRNGGPSAARLAITVRGADGELLRAGDDLEISARAAGGRWRTISDGSSSGWMTDRALDRGGQVRMDVKVSFLWEAPNGSMLDRLPLDFEVRLVQAGTSPSTTGQLPDTGSDVGRLVILLAGALVGGGVGLLAVARRRRVEESGADDDVLAIDEAVRADG